MITIKKILLTTILIFLISCTAKNDFDKKNINNIAVSYVKLVLKVGLYAPNYVDAYYGPEEWKPAEITNKQEKEFPYEQLKNEVNELISKLRKIDQSEFDKLSKLRHIYLEKQLLSIEAQIDLLSGKKMTFDEESKALYDAVASSYNESYFETILKELDIALPGKGEISERYKRFRDDFVIPKDKLDVLFKAAIVECRKRTLKFIELPENENITIEYVTDKPWGAYNWYKGRFYSLIQVNTDFPIYIDWALHFAGHEVYPGHHTHLSLMDMKLYNKKSCVEFTIFPLFSPLALIAEGTADYGIEVIFPDDEKVEFERDVLFPLIGFDPSKAEKYYKILELWDNLFHCAMIESTRRHLDGKLNKDDTIKWLKKYCFMTSEVAEKTLRSLELYRTYVINYNLGKDLIKNYIEKHGGTEDNPEKRWALFVELLSTPQTPQVYNKMHNIN